MLILNPNNDLTKAKAICLVDIKKQNERSPIKEK
jgi:hypothetical protein